MSDSKRVSAAMLILGLVLLVASAEAADAIKDVKVVNTSSEPVPVAVTNTPTVDLAAGASVKIADETALLWSGTICGSSPGGSPQVDVSGAKEVTVVLTQVSCAGADIVYVKSPVGDTGYSADIAALTVPVCGAGSTSWHDTVPGLEVSLFCDTASSPSTLAAAIYGRP